MNRHWVVFVTSVALGGGLGALSSACSGDDCQCPTTPPLPQAQEPLPIRGAATYDALGESAQLPVDPTGGTVEVTGDRVVVRYEVAGVQHEITYDVTGAR